MHRARSPFSSQVRSPLLGRSNSPFIHFSRSPSDNGSRSPLINQSSIRVDNFVNSRNSLLLESSSRLPDINDDIQNVGDRNNDIGEDINNSGDVINDIVTDTHRTAAAAGRGGEPELEDQQVVTREDLETVSSEAVEAFVPAYKNGETIIDPANILEDSVYPTVVGQANQTEAGAPSVDLAKVNESEVKQAQSERRSQSKSETKARKPRGKRFMAAKFENA